MLKIKQKKIQILLVYIIVALPAAFAAGSGFFDRLGQILSVYFNQTVNGYKEVTLNDIAFVLSGIV